MTQRPSWLKILWVGRPSKATLGRSAFIVILLAAVGFAFIATRSPRLSYGPTNAGLGPDWNCSNPGKGEPVCVKQMRADKAPEAPATESK